MSTPSRKRLMRDFKRLQQDPPAGISGAPHDNNIILWNAVIFGPDDTPWDGGESDYPNNPPTVQFVSRMFHPNNGSICLDILHNQWSTTIVIASNNKHIEKHFQKLYVEVNLYSCLNLPSYRYNRFFGRLTSPLYHYFVSV
ncbi:hypothetical protein MKX03_004676 [Papaver bracteatum]|nr:hypothetical protein MKX03_004676 [Papaver bracteatum]